MENSNEIISEWSEEYSGHPLMSVGDKCVSHDGDVLRNATVESVDLENRTYTVIIDGLGTRMSNIPISIWRPGTLDSYNSKPQP